MEKLLKNVWFWASILLVALVVVMGGLNQQKSSKLSSRDSQITLLKKENKSLKNNLVNVKKTKNQVSKKNNATSKNKIRIGQSTTFKSGSHVAIVTITSVQKVDPGFSMVNDVSQTFKDLNQFVVVNYTVKCEKGPINMTAFDGAQLSVADADGVIGKCSSGRDEDLDTLDEGKTADLRIGWGIKSNSPKISVKLRNIEWYGDITQ